MITSELAKSELLITVVHKRAKCELTKAQLFVATSSNAQFITFDNYAEIYAPFRCVVNYEEKLYKVAYIKVLLVRSNH